MSRKHISKKFNVIESGDISAQVLGQVTECEQFDLLEYRVDWNGATVSGELFVDVATEEYQKDANWYPLDFGTQLAVNVDTGDHQLLIKDITFKWIRLRYEASTGTGTLNASVKASTKGA